MDDFSKAIALLFIKNWSLFDNDFLSKNAFPPTLKETLPLSNNTEANKFASKTKIFFLKMDDFSKAIALLFSKIGPSSTMIFCQKNVFSTTLKAIVPLSNHTEANKFASKTKNIFKKWMIFLRL